MNENTEAASSRRLVVYFRDSHPFLPALRIKDDKGDRPQLVHEGRVDRPPSPPRPSRLDRLLMRLGRKPPPSKASEDVKQPNTQVIADAHKFVTCNYRSGDQVILMPCQYYDGERVIQAMEILARHLHDGTTPVGPSKAQPGGGTNARGRQIPIYAVATMWLHYDMESISLVSDGLKSRFPPGIEHIACYRWFSNQDLGTSSCSTAFDLDGSIISREISNYDRNYNLVDGFDFYSRFMHTIKHIFYYKPEHILDWDTQEPVWTKVLDSSPSGIPRNFPLSTLPAGIYQQELRRYRGGPLYSDRLVWKSFRH